VEKFILADYNADSFPDVIAYCSGKGIVTIPNKGLLTAIEEERINDFYPNPFSEKLLVKSGLSGSVKVYNSTGLLIKTIEEANGEISTKDWADGIYWFKSISEKGAVTRKLVKK
jgi:hypothetical protein